MINSVELPQFELTMESATVARWLVKEGETVSNAQPLVEIETQKAISEVASPVAGVVRKILVTEGQTVPAKSVLCLIADRMDEPLEPAASGSPEEGAVRASPAARKTARDLGIDLSRVTGTGSGGRITPADVAAFAASKSTSSPDTGWVDIPGPRLALNAQMARSLAEIPQIVVSRRMDVTPLTQSADGLTFTHRLIFASAGALRRHPSFTTVTDGRRTRALPLSVALAIASSAGLVAPVLREPDLASLSAIARRVAELRQKAEERQLRNDDLKDGPFALSNLGMLGVDIFTPFVFQGQTAVLAVGRAESVGSSRLAWLSLAADHRLVDGAEAARFLASLQGEIVAR